jgi:hypothetical protein
MPVVLLRLLRLPRPVVLLRLPRLPRPVVLLRLLRRSIQSQKKGRFGRRHLQRCQRRQAHYFRHYWDCRRHGHCRLHRRVVLGSAYRPWRYCKRLRGSRAK